MKKLFIIFAFCSFSALNGQSWISSSKISSTNIVHEISSVINDQGNVYTFGYFNDEISTSNGISLTTLGDNDYFLAKFTPEGAVDWIVQIGSDASDFVNGGIGIDSNGDIYVAGGFQNTIEFSPTISVVSSNSYDMFLAKFDDQGNIIWARNAGQGPALQYATSVNIDNTGNILLTGAFMISIDFYGASTLIAANSGFNYFYSMFNSSTGDLSWVKQASSLNTKSGSFFSIESTDDNYYFGGIFGDSTAFENDTIVSRTSEYDVHLVKTDLLGNIEWIRKISGNFVEYSFSITMDDVEDIYLTGYYDSDTLFIDENDSDVREIVSNKGSNDILVVKYDPNGNLLWDRVTGGKGEDRTYDIAFFDEKVYVSGFFSDTMYWGGILLHSEGINDKDMFTGSFDSDGNFREANSYSGINNSSDEARGLFQNSGNLYTIMKSNSDLMVLGDSIYTSTGGVTNLYIGVIGCLPISVDNTRYDHVESCYGDSTGAIQIWATGGFGAPWVYSIDNNQTSSDNSLFVDLPAGDYQVVVIDKEGCTQTGPIVTLDQPDTLMVDFTKSDILVDTLYDDICTVETTNGFISAAASGGAGPPYDYVLYPGGILQRGDGLFDDIAPGDSGKYVVVVDDANNCGPVQSDTIIINQFGSGGDCIPVGIEDGFPGQVKIYPNPTTGIFTLEMPFDEAECSMEVLNMSGQVVFKRIFRRNTS